MHGYDYLRMATSVLLALSIILSFYLMWYYSKKIIIENAPTTAQENFLLITNRAFIFLIAFSFLVVIVDFAFIVNFFNRLPKYAMIIPLIIQVIVYQVYIVVLDKKNA